MQQQFLNSTKLLNFKTPRLQALIKTKKWNDLDAYQKIKAIYGYVQNDIKFGYNRHDVLTAEEVFIDGYGQCNTKTTLLMALLRAVNIPCRVHGFEVLKHFQKGATSGIVALLAPKTIVHTWTEVYYNNQWLALEGVITDKAYLNAVKAKYPQTTGKFELYAIATNDFANLNIDWDANNTYVQSTAIVKDLGIFDSPDVFFEQHPQNLGWIKSFMYANLGCKIMNRNVKKMRAYNQLEKK